MSEAQNSPFGADFQEVKAGSFITWDEVGKSVKGILTEVDERANSLKNGELQKIYTLQLEDGTEVRVGSRGKAFDSAMKKIVKGQWVILHYAENIESKKKGNQPFKLIKVYEGQVDNDWHENNKEKNAAEEVRDMF